MGALRRFEAVLGMLLNYVNSSDRRELFAINPKVMAKALIPPLAELLMGDP